MADMDDERPFGTASRYEVDVAAHCDVHNRRCFYVVGNSMRSAGT